MKPTALLTLAPALLLAAPPAPATFTLPNGMKVALFEDHSLPLVRGELRLDLPSPADDAEAWLRPLGFRMLAAGGSGTRSATAFALASDAIGLDLALAQTASAATWTFTTRSQDQETALTLLADRLTRPAFDPIALEPARLAAWGELAEANALSRARLRFERSLHGLPEPDERALGAVDPVRLAAWHHRLFQPNRATLVLWGDLDQGQARQIALLCFGAWSAQREAPATASGGGPEGGPFLATLPGEAPKASLGLVADGEDHALRTFLRPWLAAQVKAAGLELEPGDGVILQADAPLGASAEALRAKLAAALDTLPASFSGVDLAALHADAEARERLLRLHPTELVESALSPAVAPTDLAAAKAVLERWCAPGNRRLMVSGDPGSLQGLQTSQTSTPKR